MEVEVRSCGRKSAVRSRLAGPLVSRTIAMPVMFLHSHTPHTQTAPIDFNNPVSRLWEKKARTFLLPKKKFCGELRLAANVGPLGRPEGYQRLTFGQRWVTVRYLP